MFSLSECVSHSLFDNDCVLYFVSCFTVCLYFVLCFTVFVLCFLFHNMFILVHTLFSVSRYVSYFVFCFTRFFLLYFVSCSKMCFILCFLFSVCFILCFLFYSKTYMILCCLFHNMFYTLFSVSRCVIYSVFSVSEWDRRTFLVCSGNHRQHLYLPHLLRAVQDQGTWCKDISTGKHTSRHTCVEVPTYLRSKPSEHAYG